jgi:hypothetical protein
MTLSIKIKELMAMMPDTLNSKKDVDDYYKDAMKKSVEKKKGNDNDDTKPKKALNEYQKFMKENIKTVKEKNPKLTGPEVFSMIAKLWKKEKEENTTGTASTASAVGKEKKEDDVVPVEEEDIEVSAVDTEISVDTAEKVKEDVVTAKKKDKKAK